MELAARYEPGKIEEKWYQTWLKKEYFKSEPDERKPYTIVIPPPNVTGVLHMGHMLNNTIQDVLIRKARMEGFNACWVPGTDHASIATEAKVVNLLREKGIKKSDLTREKFLEHAWDWKEKHGGIILEQLKKLGASCDWDRTRFTLEPALYESVIAVFIDLYKKGLIYRGKRMVNWDPKALTAVSDEEVVHKEVKSKLYKLRYKLVGKDEYLVIATTRPETILADTAVCVNPKDERYRHLAGAEVIVPVCNRKVPIILDDYVDMEFGTGCLKVTPAHDPNDYELGKKHGLEVIEMFTPDGKVSEGIGYYEGMDRFELRKKIAVHLEEQDLLEGVEEYINKVGYSERTDVVIEPRLSMQWFLEMKKLAIPALENVMNDNIRFFPDKLKNTYRHWMENIHDWCISRQLWWGQQIPAWYNKDEDFVVAATREEAEELFKSEGKTIEGLKQDEDVLDTWFSSWLWPISVFDGIRNPDNPDINYYYPTNTLVTAPEIMFFWVARMIMTGYEYRNEKPFENVYFTGIVRDKLGRKMSKSLGNSPDPIDLINTYGADGVRVGMLLTSPAGNDLPFDESLCEQGRNFCNKIWNGFRLIKSWEIDPELDQPEESSKAGEWMRARVNEVLAQTNEHYEKFRLSEALMAIYRLVWEDYCSWYLEAIKPAYGSPADQRTVNEATEILDTLLRILHPYTPFITEEIWSLLRERKEDDNIIVSRYPEAGDFDMHVLKEFEKAKDLVIAIRNFRAAKQVSPKEAVELFYRGTGDSFSYFLPLVTKLGNVSAVNQLNDKPENSYPFISGGTEFFIPFTENFDKEAEKARILSELDYTKGFLNSVMKKLSNEKFVNSAPEKVVQIEQKKREDAESKIKVLEEQLESLK